MARFCNWTANFHYKMGIELLHTFEFDKNIISSFSWWLLIGQNDSSDVFYWTNLSYNLKRVKIHARLIWQMDINCNALSKLLPIFVFCPTRPRRWITKAVLQLFHEVFLCCLKKYFKSPYLKETALPPSPSATSI